MDTIRVDTEATEDLLLDQECMEEDTVEVPLPLLPPLHLRPQDRECTEDTTQAVAFIETMDNIKALFPSFSRLHLSSFIFLDQTHCNLSSRCFSG